MALGGNYLDNIDNDENDKQNGSGGQGNWGIFGPPSGNNNSRGQGGTANPNNRGGGGGGGVGTAIRPPNNSNSNRGAPSNYGIGGNRRQSAGNGVPRVVKIRQPQDLLDFVVEDERLSVGKFEHILCISWTGVCYLFHIQSNTNLSYYSQSVCIMV